jgi:hypothetical protein
MIFSRRQTFVLASFVLMAAAVWGMDHYLSGGTDAAIIGDAFNKLKTARHLAGSVSVVTSVPVTEAGQDAGHQAVIITAKGRFGLPPGKTLVGAWTMTVKGANEEADADLAEMDVAVPGDGRLFVRPKSVDSALGLSMFTGKVMNQWMTVPTAALWPSPGKPPLDAAAAWQDLFVAFTSGDSIYVASREMSELVAGEPCWHFKLGLQPTATKTYGETFKQLRMGRNLTATEKTALEKKFAPMAPTLDLWVAKGPRELRQAVLSYVPQTEGQTSPRPVVVTAQIAAYPPFEPVTIPFDEADVTASAPQR